MEWQTRIIIDPGVTSDDIRACLAYASNVLHSEKVYAFGGD